MINISNLKDLLKSLGFTEGKDVYSKSFQEVDATLKVDFKKEELIYPEDKGFTVNERQTCNFKSNENFVVFECVHRLFEKGYKPKHIELEPKWKVGHGASGGRADILVKDNSEKSLLIIECKTEGKEHNDAWKKTLQNGGQLLSYVQQVKSTQFICLYSSDFVDGKAVYQNQIITLKDNEKLLDENMDKKPLSYKDAQEVEDIFKTWNETYKQDFASRGIFESDIPAYHIGKHKFSVNDLETVSSKDIQGKYHVFATILRQHNVSGRENAFDKLVNLFLCKIVDETQNPKELKFYWKGIAYDSYFDLQDRLQKLYQIGMKRFLGEDVTYIDNSKIDEAFRFFKNDPDATRETIKKYFRDLKFFTNNDFAFIDVHNEKLFYQNATVLLKIVQMLQDMHLKTNEQNQFLGDMFEGFLDQGVKQSEGQFFTPMPIVKFILASLPLESIIKDNEQVPKVIDYACGAGHFLNEYALQVVPYITKHKKTDIAEYYPEIVGIEKEYRLSKVAKVSAFMYGQDDINIIYGDALSKNPKVKDGEFSVLVANPPYSVKGFLETLSETDRNKFEIIDTIDEKSFANNNSIEAFFIERAKHLLKSGGIAGIIVPSSILSKGSSKNTSKKQNVYVATREIMLKYFDIVAIAEFGSGTFGKTGTNTVTLFLKRKKENPAPATHYKNRVTVWFKGDTSKDGVFADEHLIKKYCNHLEYSFDDYKTLLEGSPNGNILSTDVFKEYQKDFDNSTKIKNRKKQRTFKDLSKDDQKAELDNMFFEHLQKIESDKLYYFVLASLNSTNVVIVKTPTDNKAKKKFLGYGWSSAKGNEGIKYLGGEVTEDVASFEEEDARVLSNILNLNNIQTPLYDPKNFENAVKINSIISANFGGKTIAIPEELKEHVSTVKLVDMLDFSRKDFNKAISLTPKKTITIDTKWNLVKLGDVVEVKIGGTPSRSNSNYFMGNNLWVSIAEMNGQVITDTKEKISDDGVHNSNVKLIPKGTTLLSFKLSIGKTAIAGVNLYTNEAIAGLIPKCEKVTNNYLFQLFNARQIDLENIGFNTFGKSLNSEFLKSEVKIPLPPLKVQRQIIQACEAVDTEFEMATKEIEEAKKNIENKVAKVFSKGKNKKIARLNSLLQRGKATKYGNSNIQVIKSGQARGYGEFDFSERHFAISSFMSDERNLQKGDLLINSTGVGTAGRVTLFNLDGDFVADSHITIFRPSNEILSKYALYCLANIGFKTIESLAKGLSGQIELTLGIIGDIELPVVSLNMQKALIKEIEKQEEQIKKAQAIIDGIPKRKQEVIKKYL